jgi:FkbM family methyltransferase
MLLKYYQKIDEAISYLLSSTADEKKLLERTFNKKKIILVDIGSNEGNFIDFLSDIFLFKKAFCFEPIKELSEKVKKKNILNNMTVSNVALSNKKGKSFFYQYSVTSTSSLYKQNNTYKSLKNLHKTFKVETNTFDNLFNKNLKIDICKIDAQGEDYNILLGMKKNLKNKNFRLLKIELSLASLYRGSSSNFYEILNYLKIYKYTLISISKIKYKGNKLVFMDAYFEYQK